MDQDGQTDRQTIHGAQLSRPCRAGPKCRKVEGRPPFWARGLKIQQACFGSPILSPMVLKGICARVSSTPPPPIGLFQPQVPPAPEDL